MNHDAKAVTVIIPTRALRERAAVIRRAIDSVLSQAGVRAVPLIVVNGTGRDPELVQAMTSDPRLRVLCQEEAGIPAALRAGRQVLDTPWFADLDDDDLFLPGALALRVDALEKRPDCCAVITNGYRRSAAGDVLNAPDDLDVEADPMRALIRRNWLLPGGYLCRTEAVEPAAFEGMPRYLERTYFALWLLTHCQIIWLKQPTVVYHLETPQAEWRSRKAGLAQADALRQILTLELPADVRAVFRARVGRACHAASDREYREGALREAWRWHLRSLRESGGWRFLPYSRHLLRASLPF
ncbi:MAG: glycosyltransferase family 2 protein [Gemmatimonadota bacterium]|nr:MAG: glycosyltransferase family 2 protein [Gemmatimonadota bacterium]